MTFAEAQEWLAHTEYKRPPYYAGDDFYGTYAVYSIHRDSDVVDRANFQVMDELVSEAVSSDNSNDFPFITRAGHWAVGWLDTLRVPMESEEAVIAAAEALKRLEEYPVLDDDLVSETEWEENSEAGMIEDPVTGEWVYPDEIEDDEFWDDDDDCEGYSLSEGE